MKAAREAGMEIWPVIEFSLFTDEGALDRLEQYALAGNVEEEDYDESD